MVFCIVDNRKVLWVYDENGNSGKSFLARFLSNLYGYVLVTGSYIFLQFCVVT